MRFADDVLLTPPRRGRWNVLENVATNKEKVGSFVTEDVGLTGAKGLQINPGFVGEFGVHDDAGDSSVKSPPNSPPSDLNPRRVGSCPIDFSHLLLTAVAALDWPTRTGSRTYQCTGLGETRSLGPRQTPLIRLCTGWFHVHTSWKNYANWRIRYSAIVHRVLTVFAGQHLPLTSTQWQANMFTP